MDCVCLTVKQKFLDNVFENMYTSLERQVQSGPGKAVAEEVMNCLKKSKNGKLNEATRKILQDFILTTVKKNLNLTIVGGAVKTRCEVYHLRLISSHELLTISQKNIQTTCIQKCSLKSVHPLENHESTHTLILGTGFKGLISFICNSNYWNDTK